MNKQQLDELRVIAREILTNISKRRGHHDDSYVSFIVTVDELADELSRITDKRRELGL